LRLAFDTNVVVDVLLERAPFADAARQLWAAVETGRVEGAIAAHALTTVWYLVSESKSPVSARGVVALVARVFGVATVDTAVVKRALELEFEDFEDAVCAAAAEEARCDLIVTRNGKDFAGSPVTAVDPITALQLIQGGGSTGVSERTATYRSGRPKGVRSRPGARAGATARR
jgi:predicted nucleic acid-binding protein